jgi:hypothetical protein
MWKAYNLINKLNKFQVNLYVDLFLKYICLEELLITLWFCVFVLISDGIEKID